MICGIDEAGRGPLAGPVCAAAALFYGEPPAMLLQKLDDSKKLSAKQRREAEALIRGEACEGRAAFGIGWASHEEIDALNILNASLLAMRRAFEALIASDSALSDGSKNALITEIIVDGLHAPDLGALAPGMEIRALVKADALVPQVMAASILAKEERDRRMTAYAAEFPEYGYEAHKGYPTKLHCERIAQYGFSSIQRKTFRVPQKR